MESVNEYFSLLVELTEQSEWIIHQDLIFRQIDDKEAYIRGTLYIRGGFILHMAEYIIIQDDGSPERPKYRYQLQDHQGKMVSRWDNAFHHSDIPTRPFHKHLKDGSVTSSQNMSIRKLLSELDDIMSEEL